jgi:PST family polysaccharide transporter
MALTSAICVPLSQILTRSFISKELTLSLAGEWDAMNKLSSAFILFITSTLSVYFLPRLSELKTRSEVRFEVVKCLKLIVPFLLVSSTGMFFMRKIIIQTLFSDKFTEIEVLFPLQMLGDSIKVVSWIFGYILISKKLSLEFIVSEIVFSFSFYIFVVLLLPYFGLFGTSIAYAANYLLYLLTIYYLLRRKEIV